MDNQIDTIYKSFYRFFDDLMKGDGELVHDLPWYADSAKPKEERRIKEAA